MFGKIARAFRTMEQEQLLVLENPQALTTVPLSWRVNSLARLAAMSSIERTDLRQHILRYRGWRTFIPLLMSVALVNFAVTMAYWVLPNSAPGLLPLLGLTTVMASFLFFLYWTSWFFYRNATASRSTLWQCVLFVMTVSVGAGFGVHDGRDLASMDAAYVRRLLGSMFWTGAVFAPAFVIASMRNRRFELLTEKERFAERDRLARELSESQLRLLRAQIEPHFLFNSLGAVQQLAEQAGALRAAELTVNLIDFLRASMVKMRAESTSLRADFDLVEAYLRVMKVRLGDRLQYSTTLPDEFADTSVPSMMLLTLVENAIKHGIEPALRGGQVSVSAARVNGALRVRVQDSGVGMNGTEQDGNGLDNIRKRLALIYGGQAKLELDSHEDGGVTADIILPIKWSDACKPKY